MKAILAITLLCALMAATNQASCVAASLCASCSNKLCTGCNTMTDFKQSSTVTGSMTKNTSGVCVNRTALVPVGAANVAYYLDGSATSYGTTKDAVVCKTGYYAFNDAVTATQHGCYATSTVAAAPLSGITANTAASKTNCDAITSMFKSASNAKYWTCLRCASGYTLSNSGLSTAACASGVGSITNCSRAQTASSVTTCTECASGYAAASNGLTCIAETALTPNCAKLEALNLTCGTCDAKHYFNGSLCVAGAAIQTIAAFFLAVMVYMQ
jgi:hypothetical protein